MNAHDDNEYMVWWVDNGLMHNADAEYPAWCAGKAAAVLAEREACEKICDTERTRQNIAAAIRARKDGAK